MVVGICKFCGQEKKLIKLHIIPKTLYRFAKNGGVVEIDVKHTTKSPLAKRPQRTHNVQRM